MNPNKPSQYALKKILFLKSGGINYQPSWPLAQVVTFGINTDIPIELAVYRYRSIMISKPMAFAESTMTMVLTLTPHMVYQKPCDGSKQLECQRHFQS